MKKGIQERINAVHDKNIPIGYVETEAGVLPQNWKIATLGDIAEEIVERAGTHAYETLSISAGIGFVNQAQKFGKELSGKQYEKYTVLHNGDFSYNKGNSNKCPQGCIYRLNDREVAAVPNVFESFRIKSGCAEYYEQLFLSGFLNKQLTRKINHGVRDDGLLNLTSNDFYSCFLPVPPKEEQEKIAEILLSFDKIIKLKKCLISEKYHQKTWLMQNLLTCNSGFRLSKFNEVWESHIIGDLGKTYSGLTGKTNKDFGQGEPYIPYTNIFTNCIVNNAAFEYVKVLEGEKQNTVEYGDLFFTTSSETPQEVGMSSVYLGENIKLYLNSFCFGFRFDNFHIIRPEFAAYLFRSNSVKRILYKLAQGSTRYNLPVSDFLGESICIPPSTDEQQAIFNLLSSCDKEIDLLKKELQEWENKKQTYTKLLISGIVRV